MRGQYRRARGVEHNGPIETLSAITLDEETRAVDSTSRCVIEMDETQERKKEQRNQPHCAGEKPATTPIATTVDYEQAPKQRIGERQMWKNMRFVLSREGESDGCGDAGKEKRRERQKPPQHFSRFQLVQKSRQSSGRRVQLSFWSHIEAVSVFFFTAGTNRLPPTALWVYHTPE